MQYRGKKYHLFFFFTFCFVLQLAAQYEETNFTRYSVKDGLSDNGITCIQQDAQGYIWAGTDAGLNRFDGKSFRKFFQGTAPLRLPSASIWRMKRFGDDLGIISRGGFQLLNTKDYSVKNYINPDSSAFTTQLNAAWDALKLDNNNYAVSTASGFYVYSPDGKLVFRHDAYSLEDVGRERILYGRDIFKVTPNQYLAYVNEIAVAIYDPVKNTFREQPIDHPQWWPFMHDGSKDTIRINIKYQVGPSSFIFIPGVGDKAYHYDHGSKKITASILPLDMRESLNWESRIVQLDENNFILSSRINGFYILKLDRATGHIHCDGVKYVPGYKITSLFVDKDKRLWLGTSDGLLKQQLQSPVMSAFRFSAVGEKKYGGAFNCSYRYKDKLYVGRFGRSHGLAIIDPNTMQLIADIDLFGDGAIANEVRTIEMYHKDTLWLGTSDGVVWYATQTGRYGKLGDDPKYVWAKNIAGVLAPPRSDGYAWICSHLGGKLIRYHIPTRTYTEFTSQTKPALPFSKIKHIAYDSYGDVWIGGHSLARWNNRLQDFDTLITVYGGENKFNDDILMMRTDNNGSIWIHNVYNGLLEYKIKEKKFVAYSMKDGMGTDVLYSMSPVIDNKLWMAGNNNLSLFDMRTRQFTIYDGHDGLPEQKPSGRRIYYDERSGQLYLSSTEWLVRFPFHPEQKKDLSSDLVIEELRAGKKIYYQPTNGQPSFRYNENNITIDYSIIDFEKSNYQFAWRLSDQDPWNVVGQQRSLSLNNLTPGRYNIQLKASGKPGIEKTRTISFLVRPPVWKRSWFIGLAVLILAGCGWLLYRNRVRQIRQKANIDKMLSQTEMKALQAQMNPHFIFNSLNSIREMILSNENKEASHFLSKFAHLIRITLDQSTQSLVSLRNTVDYLQRYMEMESIRNSLLSYAFSIDPKLDMDEIEVPPMLIQPFIENALWHGVSAQDKRIHITIGFKKEKETLVCTIDDNGIGILQSQKKNKENNNRHRSLGISNIRDRVNLLNEKYGLHSRFTIEDKKETRGENGTLVTLHLPIEIKES
jgi:ligand-binding sensor domain-containing protein